MVDETKLNQFIGQILGDLGGAFSIPMVRIGDRLGLYAALHENGAMTAKELATKTLIAERYAREWLSHQAASGYLTFDAASGKFTLPPEQAMVFAEPDSPVYLQGAFDLAVAMMENQALVEPAFRTGRGVGWGDQAQCMFCTVARFFRPGYHNNLVTSWLPALKGAIAKLESGATVADVGCGHGVSTAIMAKAFPKSNFIGYDFHTSSVEAAREHAKQHRLTGNTKFEVATAQDFPSKNLDLITFFDCLHDMGDPLGAETRRKLDDRRARGCRSARGQYQSDKPNVLRGFDNDLCTNVPGPTGWCGTWGASRLCKAVLADQGSRIWPCPEGNGNAIQHDPGSKTLS